MAVFGFVGFPGSGKSYSLAAMAKASWEGKGELGEIFSNMRLRGVRYTYLESLDQVKDCKCGTILLDELSVWLSARDHQTLPEDISEYLQQHRKDGVDLFWSGVSFQRCWNVVRELTFWLYHCQALTAPKLPFTKAKPKPVGVFVRKYAALKPDEGLKADNCKGRYVMRFRQDVFDTYDTFAKQRKRGGLIDGSANDDLPPVALRGCERQCHCKDGGDVLWREGWDDGDRCWCGMAKYVRTDPNRGILTPVAK